MSFKLENITVSNAVEQNNYKSSIKTFPELVSGGGILSSPQSSYTWDLPITPRGVFTNMSYTGSSAFYVNYSGNYQSKFNFNITVPSASTSNPVFLNAYPSYYYSDGSTYYNYSYNTFKVTSNKPQDFSFTNYFQNTWGDLTIHYGILDPSGSEPSFTMNSATMYIVAIDTMKSDAGQFRSD